MRDLINLLPPELKQDYSYARRNTSLAHMLAMFGVGVLGLAVIVLAGMMYLQQASKVYTAQAANIEKSLQDQNIAGIEKQVQDISNSLKLSVQVLSKEVLFSQMLKQMAVITPSNVSLSGISISQLEGGVDITAKTADYNAATQLQINLSDPDNKIFSKADIVSVTCGPTVSNGVRVRYPCTATIRALFAKDNPFLFINDKAGS